MVNRVLEEHLKPYLAHVRRNKTDLLRSITLKSICARWAISRTSLRRPSGILIGDNWQGYGMTSESIPRPSKAISLAGMR